MGARVWRIVPGIAVAATLAWAPDADAFDRKRSGFDLEIGIGGGPVPVENTRPLPPPGVDYDWSRQSVRSQAAPVTRFRAGWGVGEHFLIQYVNDVWWTTTDFDGHIDAFYTTGENGIGLTYFPRAAAPSMLLELGAGIASAEASSTRRGSGLAVWGGLGYEGWTGWFARLTVGYDGAAEDMRAFGGGSKDGPVIGALTFSRAWY